jgi:hypothetical protein
MIITEFYTGQGLGNQLWLYAVLRSVAKERNLDWGIQSPWRFKGRHFLKLEMGKKVFGISSKGPTSRLPLGIKYNFIEPRMIHVKEQYDITSYNENVFHIADHTKIDGVFQCEKYLAPIRTEIKQFLSPLESKYVGKNICLIHFRGGDYAPHPTLLINPDYYYTAMRYLKEIDQNIEFRIITNDTKLAARYFPEIIVLSEYQHGEIESGPSTKLDHRIGEDFRNLQSADYLILSNSSYSWWAGWTNKNAKLIVAPKYWARHNAGNGFWSTGDIITEGWIYISKLGEIQTSIECQAELGAFKRTINYKDQVTWL